MGYLSSHKVKLDCKSKAAIRAKKSNLNYIVNVSIFFVLM